MTEWVLLAVAFTMETIIKRQLTEIENEISC